MRGMLRGVLAAMCLLAGLGPAQARDDIVFFRIATGGVGGTYYPVGGLIAQAISNPPGSRSCKQGGSCGVPGLIAAAQSAHGSVANVAAIAHGRVESGFVQSDIAYWAYTGTGTYLGQGKIDSIRLIASLYPESIHLVARSGSGLRSVLDLRGKRVSLDEEGSGTLVDARLILAAYGLGEDDLEAVYVKPVPAIDMMKAGTLDAFFFVAGYPARAVSELAATIGAELIPMEGPEVDVLLDKYPFFSRGMIPADTYPGIGEVRTVAVGAQWLVGTRVDDDLVYGITRALWHETNQQLLAKGHVQARAITLETALDGVAIPLHPGAERYYREVGMIQ